MLRGSARARIPASKCALIAVLPFSSGVDGMSSTSKEIAAFVQHSDGAMRAGVKPEDGLGRHGLPLIAEPAMHDAP